MSAFEEQMYAEYNRIPTEQLERIYWRRKLPPAMHFYLEMVSRELMLNQQTDVYAHAASFFEELVVQRDTEVNLLPLESYLEKLKRKRVEESSPPRQETVPASPTPYSNAVRCTRCGRWIQHDVGQPKTGAEDSGVPAVPTRMEVDGEVRVITIPQTKSDAFGRLLCCQLPKGMGEELITCRSLSYLVDF